MKRFFYTREIDQKEGCELVFAFTSKDDAETYCIKNGAEIVKAKELTTDDRATAKWQCGHVIGVHV